MEELLEKLAKAQTESQRQMGQMAAQMAALMQQIVHQRNTPPADPANPANPADVVHRPAAAQTHKHLSDRMEKFSYHPEDGETFDRWYARYEHIFTEEAQTFTARQLVSLLTEKLLTSEYRRFADRILPDTIQTITFEKAVEELKKIFGRKESVFALRYKCLSIAKSSGESWDEFASQINMKCEKSEIATCTADDFKVLMFVKALTAAEDSLVLEKLLIKLEEVETNRAAVADPDTVPRLKLNDVCELAKRLSCLKDEKLMVQYSNSAPKSEVMLISRKQGYQRQNTRKSIEKLDTPPNNCYFCGDCHWHKDCPYKDKICETCKVKGHKAGNCTSANEFLRRFRSRPSRFRRRSERRQSLAVTTGSISTRKFVEPAINDHKLRLQLDSGSDWTIISKTNWQKIGEPSLTPCEEQAISASGDQVSMLGKFTARLKLHGREEIGPCYVANSSLNVLGSDWMEALDLWKIPIVSVCNNIRDTSQQFPNELKTKFPALFSDSLGLCTQKVSLTLKPGAKPIFRNSRPVPFAAMEPIENEIKRLQLLNVISPVRYSSYAAPIVAVKKKDGRIRICADYSTGLNDSLEPEQFPLPTPDEIFAQLSSFKLFSKIDLSDAFLQVELDDNSKKLMTINTHCGLFKVNRLQPGVKPAPGIFQRLVSSMMSGAKGAFPFIDDFIVGGTDQNNHDKNLCEVLGRIQENGFHLKIDKCGFRLTQLEFLGHRIDATGIKPSPDKIKTLENVPPPTDVKQLQAFLGAVTWYGKFIPGIKKYRGPLDQLLQDDITFTWEEKHQESFDELKKILASDLGLAHYDPTKKLIVAADASSYGMGAVLMHEMTDKLLRPVMHAARSFTAAEKYYPQIQREALALTFALQKFHRYIYGRKFELQTDHKPLLAIFGNKKGIPVHTASRLQRYALILLAYDFEIKYVNTKSFAYVDFISRLISQHEKPNEDVVIGKLSFEINNREPSLFPDTNSAAGEGETNVNEKSLNHAPREDSNFIAKIIAEGVLGCFAIDTAKKLPVTFEAIQYETNRDETLKVITNFIENGWPRKREQIPDAEAAAYFPRRDSLTVINGCIFFGDRIIIPKRYRSEILKELHQGHPGTERMKLLARQKVSWPSLDSDVEKTVRTCANCATNAFSPIKVTLQSWPIPEAPWYYKVQTDKREIVAHANQLKKRYTYLDDGHNVLLDSFDIHVPGQQEIEPEIIPEPEEREEEVQEVESIQDALDDQQEDSEEDLPAPQEQVPRRTQRATAGVPPSYLGDYVC